MAAVLRGWAYKLDPPRTRTTNVLTMAMFEYRCRHETTRDGDDATTGSFWWRSALMRDPCVYCGRRPDGLDHIKPKANGGPNGWQNRAPACRTCDATKRSRSLLMFLLQDRPGSFQGSTTGKLPKTAETSRQYRRALIQARKGLTQTVAPHAAFDVRRAGDLDLRRMN